MTQERNRGNLPESDHAPKHEKNFRVSARRNKLLGLWAAKLMNMRDADVQAYAVEVVSSDLDEPGDEDVLRKVMGDFARLGVDMPREQVRQKMDELLAEARHQLGIN
jgi:hypothetical protein